MKYDVEKPQAQPESFYRVMLILADTIHHFGKKYCYPGQRYLLSVLKKHHGYKIERRQLNYILAFLEKSGQIKRIKRHYRGQDGRLVLKSTLFFIKKTGWKLINRFRRIIGKAWGKAAPKRPEIVLFDGRPTSSRPTSISEVLKGFVKNPDFSPG